MDINPAATISFIFNFFAGGTANCVAGVLSLFLKVITINESHDDYAQIGR